MISPYKAAQVLNEILRANDVAEIPPQMIYNYVKKGVLRTYEIDGRKYVDENGTDTKDFAQWAIRYCTKKGIVLVDEPTNTEVDGQLALEV